LIRDYTDYAYACYLTISDGILDTLKALVIVIDGYYKTSSLKKIREFVEKGGMLVGIGLKYLRDLDRDEDWLDILFGNGEKAIGKGRTKLIDGDIYGETVTVFFEKYIRDIEKFDSKEHLREQITKDLNWEKRL
jgi:hypothetical protein